MDKYERRFVDYAMKLSYESLTKEAVQAVKERLLDALGCALAAYDTPAAVSMRKFASNAYAEKGATLIGTKHRAPLYDAVLFCGALIRALDWNDTYFSKEMAHPSDNIAATLMAAEAENKSGADFITATALAYEFQCRLCDACAIRKKGWDHVVFADISCTAGAGKLLGLNKEELRHAIAIAVTTGNYLRQTRIGEISAWKASAFAQGARNAVEAVLYAHCGMTGPYNIMEGESGMVNVITRNEFNLAEKFGGEGENRFKVEETSIKCFPAEYHSQSAIWAALELKKDVDVRDIDSIVIETSMQSHQIIGTEKEKWHPKTKETADHSLPYITCAALMDGELTLRQFDKEHLADEKLLSLVQKVKVKEKDEYTKLYGTSFPNKVSVTLKNGQKFEKEVINPKGHPLNPLAEREIETKFASCTKGILSDAKRRQLIEKIWNLEKIGSMREIIELLC